MYNDKQRIFRITGRAVVLSPPLLTFILSTSKGIIALS